MEPQQQTPQRPRIPGWVWLLILGGLIVWNLWAFQPKRDTETNIPYTTFLDQVRAGNVASVRISGDQINGKFVKPIVWPRETSAPELTAEPSPQATSDARPAPTEPVTGTSGTTGTYQDFDTTFPEVVGDLSLMPLLRSKGVTIEVSSPSTPWLPILLSNGLPLLLLLGVMVWMGRRAAQGQSGLFNFGRSRARRHVGQRTEVTFDDVAGADEAKAELEEVVDFLRNPSKYHDIGARIPRGVLLV
jgi:cell division protease FtsH